jgi:hypothetical protein
MGKNRTSEKAQNAGKTQATVKGQAAVETAGQAQGAAAGEEKGSGIFLWVFIGLNVAFAILFIIKFFWG